jgi:hypothetical protein
MICFRINNQINYLKATIPWEAKKVVLERWNSKLSVEEVLGKKVRQKYTKK